MARSQNSDHQRAEDHLQGAAQPEGAEEHAEGEEPPEGQVEAHGRLVALLCQPQGRQNPDGYQRQPEGTVGRKRRQAEGVVLFGFEKAREDLGDAADKNAHAHDHRIDGIDARIVDVQQDGGQAEPDESQGAGFADVSLMMVSVVTSISLGSVFSNACVARSPHYAPIAKRRTWDEP